MELTGWKCFRAFAGRRYRIASVWAAAVMAVAGVIGGRYFGYWAVAGVGPILTGFLGILDFYCISEFNKSGLGCMNFARSSFFGKIAVEKYIKADICFKTITLALGFVGCLATSIVKGGVFPCLTGFGLFLGALFFLIAFVRNKCLSINVNMVVLEFGLMFATAVLIGIMLLMQLAAGAGFGLPVGSGFTALSAVFAFAGGKTLYRICLKNFAAGYRPTENL